MQGQILCVKKVPFCKSGHKLSSCCIATAHTENIWQILLFVSSTQYIVAAIATHILLPIEFMVHCLIDTMKIQKLGHYYIMLFLLHICNRVNDVM